MLNYSILISILGCQIKEPTDSKDTGTTSTEPQDLDGDGFSVADGDCNDEDANIYPGAPISYNDGIDQDCQDGDELCDYLCYDSCDEPYASEQTFTVTPNVFEQYLNEEGLLTEESCSRLCYDIGWEYFANIIEVYECRDEGLDEESNHLVYCSTLNAPYCEGRLHEGSECAETKSSSPLGSWFARAAQAEAISVQSFLILAKQLKALRAPENLIQACMQAAIDEVHHAGMMMTLAKQTGSDVPKLSFGAYTEKSAIDVAIENATEGCIHEGYAALQALHQSRHAKDPTLRKIMTKIAQDEARHVELAFHIDTWLKTQLTQQEQELVKQAKRNALMSLEQYLKNDSGSPYDSELGLIESDDELLFFEQFKQACA